MTFCSRRARGHFCIARCARWWARWSRSALGSWSAGDFKAAFEAADRSRCGPVAPPLGLYLVRVDYAGTHLGEGRRLFLPRECGGGGPPEGRWRGLDRPMRAPSTTIANARRLRRALSPPERVSGVDYGNAPGSPTFAGNIRSVRMCSISIAQRPGWPSRSTA